MSSQLSQTSAPVQNSADEPYIPVEEIAQRLDLPLTILLRRIEAGDVPARRLIGGGRSGWGIRLSDLGIEADATMQRGVLADELPETAVDTVETVENTEPEALEPVAVLPGRITRYERGTRGPRAEVAGMYIDSREMVTGLLDRWERTLEQRIFIEQRQRFEGELNARQNLVKQLQLELQAVHAEHAAYIADSERRHAELEHKVADLQRELAAAYDASERRRGGLFHRR
ncbi:MAG: hypothetical protein ACREN2_12325 [Candidatus Dormibacteria bacterium]